MPLDPRMGFDFGLPQIEPAAASGFPDYALFLGRRDADRFERICKVF